MDTVSSQAADENIIYFCGCILDCDTQTLQTKTAYIRLRSKLWQVLYALAQHPNKLIKREQLIEDIWQGNNYTGEQGLTHAVCHIRRILRQHKIAANIVTLPKKGYIIQQEQNLSDSNHQIVNAFSINTVSGFHSAPHNSQPDIKLKYNFR